MAQNYIIPQCCSVADLQSYLRSWKPTDPVAVKQAIINIEEAIDYEGDHQKRVSIRNLLTAKKNALSKLITVTALSCDIVGGESSCDFYKAQTIAHCKNCSHLKKLK